MAGFALHSDLDPIRTCSLSGLNLLGHNRFLYLKVCVFQVVLHIRDRLVDHRAHFLYQRHGFQGAAYCLVHARNVYVVHHIEGGFHLDCAILGPALIPVDGRVLGLAQVVVLLVVRHVSPAGHCTARRILQLEYVD